MATIDQDVEHIRHAVYGKDVREAIADGISQMHEVSKQSIIAHPVPSNNDFNNVTGIGTYMLANDTAYINSPIPQGIPAILEVISVADAVGYAVTQRITAIYEYYYETYVRVGRYNSQTGRYWLEWTKEPNAKSYGPLFSPTDLNDIIWIGTYMLVNSITYTNSPIPQGTPAFLEVISSPKADEQQMAVTQRITSVGTADYDSYVRIGRYNSQTGRYWSEWQSLGRDIIRSELWPLHSVLFEPDFNNVTSPGVYFTVNAIEYANNPFSSGIPIFLEVFGSIGQTTITQRITAINGVESDCQTRIGRKNEDESYRYTEWKPAVRVPQNVEESAGADSFGRAVSSLQNYSRKYNETAVDMDDEITWENGGINDTTGTEISTLTKYRSGFYKTYGNEMFVISYDSFDPTYICAVAFYDNERSFLKYIESATEPIWNGVTYDNNDVQMAAGEGYVRFCVRKKDNSSITTGEHSDFTLLKNTFGSKAMIRIGTHNVRNWGTEFSLGYRGNMEPNRNTIKELYNKSQIDVLGIQEFSTWLDNPHTVNSADIISNSFKHLYFAYYTQWSPIASQFEINDIQRINFPTGRFGMYGNFSYNGKTIRFINFHASPNGKWHGDETRPAEYRQVLGLMQEVPYAICTADFNSRDFSIFTNAGMKTALPQGSEIDNIIITPTLQFGNVRLVPEYNTSDHRLVWADVIVP